MTVSLMLVALVSTGTRSTDGTSLVPLLTTAEAPVGVPPCQSVTARSAAANASALMAL